MSNLLSVRNLHKEFVDGIALWDVSFSVSSGEICVLMGRNGSGKSTIAKIISGAIMENSGEIFLNGKKVKIKNPMDAKKLGINILYQDNNLFEELSVAENLFLGNLEPVYQHKFARLGFLSWNTIYSVAEEFFEKYELDIDVYKKVKDLGMGDKRIIEIMKAMMHESRVLILDEPTSTMHTHEIELFLNLLEKIKSKGVGILYITHNIEEALKIADKIIILSQNTIKLESKIDEIKPDEIIHLLAGDTNKSPYPKIHNCIKEELLSVKNLVSTNKLKNLNFELHKGEILGVTGLTGSGKSNLAKALIGLDQESRGKFFINGMMRKIKNPRDAIDFGIVYLPEDRLKSGIMESLSVLVNLTISHLKGIESEYIPFVLNKKYEKSRVKKYLKVLSIKTVSAAQTIRSLSAGNQQKVMISRALFSNAKIFIFDEPTKSLDIATKVEIYNIMNALTMEKKGILFISSDLAELMGMCDRILVMRKGEIRKVFSRSEFDKEKILSYLLTDPN